MNYIYFLEGQGGVLLHRHKLPIVLNIGTQFENQQGSYSVKRIVKHPTRPGTVYFYCEQINTTPWLLDHLAKHEQFQMEKR